jgi:hypothetical protein
MLAMHLENREATGEGNPYSLRGAHNPFSENKPSESRSPLSRDLWAITCYFNPLGYQSRLKNYRIFKRRLIVPLVAVELSHDGQYHLGSEDAEILIQIKCEDLLWQKERLLNVALQSVPRDCSAVAWLDCDVVFENADWPARASELLQTFKIVEPFEFTYETPKDGLPGDLASKEDEGYSLMYALAKGIAPLEILRGNMRLDKRISSGLAWVAQRAILDKHGFYDACVMGSGNRAITCAMMGRFDDAVHYLQMNPNWAGHYLAWAQPLFDSVQGSVGYMPGGLFHLWHGDLKNRRYAERHKFLSDSGFDPTKDIFIDGNGVWRWSASKTNMGNYIRGYFESRREDG